jgi:hypothetical protein
MVPRYALDERLSLVHPLRPVEKRQLLGASAEIPTVLVCSASIVSSGGKAMTAAVAPTCSNPCLPSLHNLPTRFLAYIDKRSWRLAGTNCKARLIHVIHTFCWVLVLYKQLRWSVNLCVESRNTYCIMSCALDEASPYALFSG